MRNAVKYIERMSMALSLLRSGYTNEECVERMEMNGVQISMRTFERYMVELGNLGYQVDYIRNRGTYRVTASEYTKNIFANFVEE